MRILGIDPGLRITGYGCIDVADGATSLVEAGIFRLGRAMNRIERDEVAFRVGDAESISARLTELDRDFRVVLDRLRPEVVAVEALFSHYKHPATAIVMGHSRGVLLLAIRQLGLSLVELKPTMVKKAVTGNGLAKKRLVQGAVMTFLGLSEIPEPPDMADALAVAICASRRVSTPAGLSTGLSAGPRLPKTRRADKVVACPSETIDSRRRFSLSKTRPSMPR
jgi:crossover junction endodeoxyribonuclease RuvC